MTFDRDEQFLHEKLSTDLHPAPVDLWPAVAENLPAKPHRRHLWLCLAAPLLIAAGRHGRTVHRPAHEPPPQLCP